MFAYVSKTVSKAYKVSKKYLKKKPTQFKDTKAYQLINQLCKLQVDVLPISKMTELATMSFELVEFQVICAVIMEKLEGNVDAGAGAHRYVRNLLLLTSYLIKHGAGGFVDQFRQCIQIFENFTEYGLGQAASFNKESSRMEQVRGRAGYIVTLLTDKEKLLREKQLAMLVRQKMRIYDSENREKNSQIEEKQQKASNFIETYIWKYVNKVDKKMDDLAEILADQVQKLILGEIPDSFEIDEPEDQNFHMKTEGDISSQVQNQEKQFAEKKISTKKENQNLLDL